MFDVKIHYPVPKLAYLIVEIPEALHRKLRIKSATEGKTIKEIVNNMLKKELK